MNLPAVCVLAGLLAGAPGPTGRLDPKDGPDVDLRVAVLSEAIRMTVTMNLAFIDEFVPMARENPNTLHEAEYGGMQADLVDLLRQHTTLAIDGVVVPPVSKDFAFAEGELDLLPNFPGAGMRALTRCRLVLEYPVKETPRVVALTWGLYPPDYATAGADALDAPPIVVKAQWFAEGTVSDVTFLKEEPEFVWRATGRSPRDDFLPVPEAPVGSTRAVPPVPIALGLLWVAGLLFPSGRGRRYWLLSAPLFVLVAWFARDAFTSPSVKPPSREEALRIFLPLHGNIYRAFDYTDEDSVYDALAESVTGDLLDATYDDVYESLVMRDEDGAISRVTAVRPTRTEVERIGDLEDHDARAFQVRAQWEVDGKVTHWGHAHMKTNAYSARYTIVPVGRSWRIAEREILGQIPISGEPLPEEPR